MWTRLRCPWPQPSCTSLCLYQSPAVRLRQRSQALNMGAREAASSPRRSHAPHPGLVRPIRPCWAALRLQFLVGPARGSFRAKDWVLMQAPALQRLTPGPRHWDTEPLCPAAGHLPAPVLLPSSLSTHHHGLCKDKCIAHLLLGVFPDEHHPLIQHRLRECLPRARHCHGYCGQLREQHRGFLPHVGETGRTQETRCEGDRVLPAGHSQREPVPSGAPVSSP